MLINLRNALMGGKRLPYDAEVEFLESTGTQYIDTGISGAEHNLIITAGVRINTYGTYAGAFGNYASESANSFRLILAGLNNGQAYANCGYITSSSHIINAFSLGVWHTIVLNGAEDRCFCDGVEYTKGNRYLQGTANANTIRIFTSGGAAAGIWSKQFSAFKVELNGVLVRDYIPVRKGTVGYLYDRVSGKLFGNAGTGDFVLGPDVVPVEWLEGGQLDGGIAFIDTGYSPNSSTKMESTSAILSANGYSGRFGNQSRFTFGASNGSLYLAQGGHYFIGGYTAGTFYSFVNDIQNRTVSVEGVGSTSTTAVSDWYSQLYPVYLFASNVAPNTGTVVNGKNLDPGSFGRIRMKSCSIWENDILVHKYLPFRVGTEGAMMDVLTRRIYRNAGTGAFTYGNDLKYPIPAA